MFEIYTGQPRPRPLPRLRDLRLSKTQDVMPGETIEAEFSLRSSGEGALKYGFWISTSFENILEYYVNRSFDPQAVSVGPNRAALRMPNEEGIYRVYAYVRDGHGNITSMNRTVRVGPGPVPQDRPAPAAPSDPSGPSV